MKKILIQCDFDGTVLEEDISFMILEEFAQGDWHVYDDLYNAGKLTVAEFNAKAFGLVKAGYAQQMAFIKGKDKLRPGFRELLQLCQDRHIKFVIVSNGFDFYIKYTLDHLGLSDVEYHAGQVTFHGESMKIDYFGAEGNLLQSGFKDSFTDRYLREGYEIIYIGDGMSDLSPAKKCRTVFACKSLAERCQKAGLPYKPFRDFHDVIAYLHTLRS
ncbi:MAG: HAD-IB family phosphatase [Dehalococcoidales bacterium]|nr:HAD-IB family phosphatase [Dehalococcoidales bacterium]